MTITNTKTTLEDGSIVEKFTTNLPAGAGQDLTTFVVPERVKSVQILIVGGGGSGGIGLSGINNGGGGGAGGMLEGTLSVVPGTELDIKIGRGGIGTSIQSSNGNAGGNSSITKNTVDFIAYGGGYGGGGSISETHYNGGDGGSGGGGGAINTGHSDLSGNTIQTNQDTLIGYGFNGGNGNTNGYGGGGGGAGSAGSSSGTQGNGLVSTISGSSITYASGGQSGGITHTGVNGLGSGGFGFHQGTSGSGGSGIVIIRYTIPTQSPQTTPELCLESAQFFRSAKYKSELGSTITINKGIM